MNVTGVENTLGLICLAIYTLQIKPSQGVCCANRHLPRSRALIPDYLRRNHVHCQHRTDWAASPEYTDKTLCNKHDAVVVLGGGLTSVGGIPAWGQQRLQTALSIHKETSAVSHIPGLLNTCCCTTYRTCCKNASAGVACPLLCLGGGTPHKPAVLSNTGHAIHESSAYTSYLLKHVSSMSIVTTPSCVWQISRTSSAKRVLL